ncbi:hypothetical protein P4O66_022439 [Electrophorus voltai]|uniref:SAND domain-containing protein n=1 Tax=Electrophorus voltai TaxID=2609070 RepID=A0AAD9E2C2_9TELE|nr:hypothetical protein P4O66_022439 [Electrophorus voltai]
MAGLIRASPIRCGGLERSGTRHASSAVRPARSEAAGNGELVNGSLSVNLRARLSDGDAGAVRKTKWCASKSGARQLQKEDTQVGSDELLITCYRRDAFDNMPAIKKERLDGEDMALAAFNQPEYLAPLNATAIPVVTPHPPSYDHIFAHHRAYLGLHDTALHQQHLHHHTDDLMLERFSSIPDFQPFFDNGEPCIEVECGENKALLYINKLCQGSKGPSIKYRGEWLTPNEFQFVSGRETAKDWKRSIRHKGKSLKTLMSKGILQVHPPICDCPGCRISSPVRPSARGQMTALFLQEEWGIGRSFVRLIWARSLSAPARKSGAAWMGYGRPTPVGLTTAPSPRGARANVRAPVRVCMRRPHVRTAAPVSPTRSPGYAAMATAGSLPGWATSESGLQSVAFVNEGVWEPGNRGRLAEKRTIPLPPSRVPKKELASVFSSDDSEGSERVSLDHADIKQEEELHYTMMRKSLPKHITGDGQPADMSHGRRFEMGTVWNGRLIWLIIPKACKTQHQGMRYRSDGYLHVVCSTCLRPAKGPQDSNPGLDPKWISALSGRREAGPGAVDLGCTCPGTCGALTLGLDGLSRAGLFRASQARLPSASEGSDQLGLPPPPPLVVWI